MTERAVYRSGKEPQGDITSLCGDFGTVLKANAIREIESGVQSYYVPLSTGSRAKISVVYGPRGKFLRTNWDGTLRNNLDDLPDC